MHGETVRNDYRRQALLDELEIEWGPKVLMTYRARKQARVVTF